MIILLFLLYTTLASVLQSYGIDIKDYTGDFINFWSSNDNDTAEADAPLTSYRRVFWKYVGHIFSTDVPPDPFNVTESEQSVNPIRSIEQSKESVESVNSLKPTKEIKPVKKVKTVKSVKPVKTNNQAKSDQPAESANLVTALKSAYPVKSAKSVKNVNLDKPAKLTKPFKTARLFKSARLTNSDKLAHPEKLVKPANSIKSKNLVKLPETVKLSRSNKTFKTKSLAKLTKPDELFKRSIKSVKYVKTQNLFKPVQQNKAVKSINAEKLATPDKAVKLIDKKKAAHLVKTDKSVISDKTVRSPKSEEKSGQPLKSVKPDERTKSVQNNTSDKSRDPKELLKTIFKRLIKAVHKTNKLVNPKKLIRLAKYIRSGEQAKSTIALKSLDLELPRQENYVTRNIDSCPDVGYFFKRELTKEGQKGPCFLCFCKENDTAICWPRNNKRCNAEHYHHHGVGKRDARSRRSAAAFSTQFFKDAAMGLFGQTPKESCRPFLDSYSEGCPPDDWCTGCTVCDCDARGQYQCHVLSFCPEKEEKKNMHRGAYKRKIYRRKMPSSKTKNEHQDNKTTVKSGKVTKNPPKSNKKVTKNSPVKKQTKKIQMSPVKKSPKVNKNQPARRSPQLKRTPANKRNPKIKKTSAKRTQEIKKSPSLKINQKVNKNTIRRSSQVKKKKMPSKFPSRKKVPPKSQVKKNLPKKSPQNKKNISENKAPLEKRSITSIVKPVIPKKRSMPNSNQPTEVTKKYFPRKVKLTSRPVVVNTNSLGQSKTASPKPINVTTVALDINKQIRQEVVKTFMATFQKVMEKNLGKKLNKRSIQEDVVKDDERDLLRNTTETQIQNESLIERKSLNSVKISFSNSTAFEENETSTASPEDVIEIVTDHTIASNSTAYTNDYYKYSVEIVVENTTLREQIETTTKNTTLKRSVESVEHFKPNLEKADHSVKQINISIFPMNESIQNKTGTESTLKTVDNFNDANDLKFDKWSQVKAIKNKEQILRVGSGKNLTAAEKNPWKNNFTIEYKRKIKSSNVARRLGAVEKKYKLKKVLNTFHERGNNIERITIKPDLKISSRLHKNESKLGEFKNFIKNIIDGFSKKNSTKKSRSNRFKVIKYLQKIVKKIFNKNSRKTKGSPKNRTNTVTINKNSVLETVCESFGPCIINQKTKIEIEPKIEDLSIETMKMLKTIKTIKGLLRLVDFAKHDRELNDASHKNEKQTFKSDIQKLNAILRGNYTSDENMGKFTQTQITQIDYIKKYTTTFIQSTSKFAKILNEIVDRVTAPKDTKKDEHKRISRYLNKGKEIQHTTFKSASIETMKDLLMKYNLLQNQFVEKMYHVLSKFKSPKETKNKKGHNLKREKKKSLEYNVPKKIRNNTEAVQIYTNNIIKNLRKLKTLAQTLIIRNRRKRELRGDDDTMEYLLVLMEYLMKQNYPLDAAPVNDGIDLLIEAIKHAPDIKSVKKKVLQNVPHKVMMTNATHISNSISSTEAPPSNEDSISDNLNKLSKEDNFTSTQDDTKLNVIEESVENNSNTQNKPSNRRADVKFTTGYDYYKKYDFAQVTTETIFEETTKPYMSNISKEVVRSIFTPPYDKRTINIIEKPVSSDEKDDIDEEKNMDIFQTELDDDVTNMRHVTSTTELHNGLITKHPAPPCSTTTEKLEIVYDDDDKPYEINVNKEDVSASRSVDRKYLDWLDESFEEEMKPEANISQTVKTKSLKMPKKTLENISSQTKESIENKKKQSNADSDEVIYKKEMNLLNSLDYGKSESDDSVSKEVLEDKYTLPDISEGITADYL